MIARIWHGRVPTEKADAYYELLQRTGIPDYRNTEGNRGVYVLRRTEGPVTHYTLISFWESLEAIKRFAAIICWCLRARRTSARFKGRPSFSCTASARLRPR